MEIRAPRVARRADPPARVRDRGTSRLLLYRSQLRSQRALRRQNRSVHGDRLIPPRGAGSMVRSVGQHHVERDSTPPMVQQHARMASSRACGQLQAAVRYDHRACTLTSCSMVLVVQGAAMPWLWCVRRFLWLVGWWHAIELRRGRELRRRRELRRGLAVSRSACRTTWASRPSRRAQRLPHASSVSDGAVPSTGRR